ncbi:MAG: hypothetical protein JNJ49_00215 [Bdellovibrionaceae bacterium]|nr:hypothetical protein [Pseudobdellovibrionaceae bacterium]
MPKLKFSAVKTTLLSFKDLYRTFVQQKIAIGFILAALIFILSIIFTLLAYSPVLSPFLYPLF